MGFPASRTDPDSSPMKRRGSKGSHLGYHAPYVADGGKARAILGVLVTPFEVTENAPRHLSLRIFLHWCSKWLSFPTTGAQPCRYGLRK